MSQGDLNLARRPFVNGRPVTRIALLLCVAGGLLLLYTLYHYLGYVSNTGALRAQLAQVESQKSQEQATIRQLNERFAGLNLARQNEQVDYLNDRIRERTFSWSELFDRLSRVMPGDVRLTHLAPHGVIDPQADRRRRGTPAARKKGADDRVTLVLAGEAKTDTALLKFVDNLFGDPIFIDPDLIQQSREGGRDVIRFDLRVGYLPRGTQPAMPAAPAAPARPKPSVPAARRPQGQAPADRQKSDAVPPGNIRRTPPTFSTPSASATGTVVGVPGVGVPGVVPPPHRPRGVR